MSKLSKSRLLKSIPFFGSLFFLIVFFALLYWPDLPEGTAGLVGLGPAILLFLVAVGLISLGSAIVVQCVVIGAWWQYGHGPYLAIMIVTLAGLKLGEWIGNWWQGVLDSAKAEEAVTTGNAKPTGAKPR